MNKYIVPFLLGVTVSFYFFPVQFTFFPAFMNTKNLMAALGVFVFVMDAIRNQRLLFSKDVFFSAVLAALFSAACYVSTVLNYTDDMTYVTYIVSFFVWLSGGYFVCWLLRQRYGCVTVEIITEYLMYVGVCQCISMLMIDNIPAFKSLVDSTLAGNQFVANMGRKYGIGASLDPAGVRFTIILVMTAFVSTRSIFPERRSGRTFLWLFSFLFITIFGNMISRTTTVGAAIGLAYMLLYFFTLRRGSLTGDRAKAVGMLFLILAIGIPVVAYLYNTSPSMHSNLRFAFEGFFNWVETGVWRTDSTDKLNNVMWVWPTDRRTWLIGSGLIDHFVYSTDIGYCRFILYCGILGFSIFCLFFIYNACAVAKRFEGVGLLAVMLLSLTFIIWIKVSTDIFQIYAMLFCLDAYCAEDLEEDDESEDGEEDEEPATVYKGIAKGILD